MFYTQHNNDDERRQSFRKIYLSLYLKGVSEREQNCNILTPTLMAISVSFPFSWVAQPGAWGPAFLGAGFLYRILSPTHLISKLINREPEGSLCWALNYHITQCTGNSISSRQDAVEKASTQQRKPSGPRLFSLETRPVEEKKR